MSSNSHNPFDLNNDSAYKKWRDQKLHQYPDKAEYLIVEVNDAACLSRLERDEIMRRCKKANMAVYISRKGISQNKQMSKLIAQQMGLKTIDRNMGADGDGVTSLQVSKEKKHERYIPYSNKAIHWHTDGYYNSLDKQVNALNLHCVRPAQRGGENALLDHEVAYIRLRDENPEFIRAFMVADAMSVPANFKHGVEIRPERVGPVFSVNENGRLHMRYTARAHNIVWKDDELTQAAVKALLALLNSQDSSIYRLTLKAGWGLISNNVLHDRSEFVDCECSPRLLYRLRYYENISDI